MVTYIFRLSILAIIATIMLVIFTPVLSLNKLLYPVKIDSAYVNQQQLSYLKSLQKGAVDTGMVFLYSPDQLSLPYTDMEFIMHDSIKLRGWLTLDTLNARLPLLFIIPDITEGAINYLPAMKQFSDRGFNVCVMNMRAQGNSEGKHFDFNKQASADVNFMVNELKKMAFIDKVAILGNRTGAAIAILAVADSAEVADVLVLQNPVRNLWSYFNRQALTEWGSMIVPLMPALRRSYEQQTGVSIGECNYEEIVSSLFVPQMMVAANFFSKKTIDETIAVYKSSNYFKKQLFIDNNTFQKVTGIENNKHYYDKISAFINSSLPSKSKKTRFRKLVINEVI